MKKTWLLFVLAAGIVLSACSKSTPTQKYITENNINATIIVSSLNTGKENILNKERSEERFLPASTFKIPNTLIALQEGVIKDENDIIKWDGKDKGFPEWNKDQTLKTAFPSSCVWFYQELAKGVGLSNYEKYLKELNYGNMKTGALVDTFWLAGDIRISAKEQIEFLKKLYREEFNFDQANYDLLKKLMIVEEHEEYIIRAKTGWVQRVERQIGWYVGYVETPEDVWFFAMNLDIIERSDADYRNKLVMDYLKDLKIIK